jgi:large subunit ribosomal protein LP0
MTDEVTGPAPTPRTIRKASLKQKIDKLLVDYKNILVCTVDNVGSHQMQKVRISLRGKAVVLMGKNTICRKAIREHLKDNPQLEALLPYVKGNIGFVFTNDDLNGVRKVILENKVPAAAKQGSIAPIDVFVPPGPTGLDPGQTGFFQALNISTKIARGSIEIINEVHLIKAGEKVSSSHVALLSKLNINPFFLWYQSDPRIRKWFSV